VFSFESKENGWKKKVFIFKTKYFTIVENGNIHIKPYLKIKITIILFWNKEEEKKGK